MVLNELEGSGFGGGLKSCSVLGSSIDRVREGFEALLGYFLSPFGPKLSPGLLSDGWYFGG